MKRARRPRLPQGHDTGNLGHLGHPRRCTEEEEEGRRGGGGEEEGGGEESTWAHTLYTVRTPAWQSFHSLATSRHVTPQSRVITRRVRGQYVEAGVDNQIGHCRLSERY